MSDARPRRGALTNVERARRAELLADGLKPCPLCGRTLPIECFLPKASATSGMRSYCRECERPRKALHAREYRRRHPEEARAKDRAYYAKHREHEKAQVARVRAKNPAVILYRQWRERGCVVCGITDYRIVEGHHVDPSEKEARLGALYDLDAMRAELAKCVPLCRNHHTLVHAELRNGFRGAALQDVIDYLRGEHA